MTITDLTALPACATARDARAASDRYLETRYSWVFDQYPGLRGMTWAVSGLMESWVRDLARQHGIHAALDAYEADIDEREGKLRTEADGRQPGSRIGWLATMTELYVIPSRRRLAGVRHIQAQIDAGFDGPDCPVWHDGDVERFGRAVAADKLAQSAAGHRSAAQWYDDCGHPHQAVLYRHQAGRWEKFVALERAALAAEGQARHEAQVAALREWEAGAPAREAAAAVAAEQRRIAEEQAQAEAEQQRQLQLDGLAPLPETKWGHLAWLRLTFGDDGFEAADVRFLAQAAGWTALPGAPDPASGSFTRQLGKLYVSIVGDDIDGLMLVVAGSHARIARYRVKVTGAGVAGSSLYWPPYSYSPTHHRVGG